MNRTARRVAAGALGAAAVVAAVAAERAAVRRARSLPQPSGGGSLDERPGADLRVPSFDGTEIAVSVVGPAAAPAAADGPGGGGVTFVFAHGFSLDLTTWHYQWRHFSRRRRKGQVRRDRQPQQFVAGPVAGDASAGRIVGDEHAERHKVHMRPAGYDEPAKQRQPLREGRFQKGIA